MRTARMSVRRQWRNMGANANKSGISLEAVLTGKPGFDALIRDGFSNPGKRRTEEELAEIARVGYEAPREESASVAGQGQFGT